MTMILHLLLNVWMMEQNHWSLDFLEYAKEIVLLLPMMDKCETMVAVGVIYLTDKNIAMLSQIDSSRNIAVPFIFGGCLYRRGTVI
jgi:hypothetical protein